MILMKMDEQGLPKAIRIPLFQVAMTLGTYLGGYILLAYIVERQILCVFIYCHAAFSMHPGCSVHTGKTLPRPELQTFLSLPHFMDDINPDVPVCNGSVLHDGIPLP